jgi:anthranilate/para-aminobenzoate synthase component II
MTLLIDNYDSFSYNLYQVLGSLDSAIRVIRNDELTVEEVRALNPSAIVISPGPGRCEDAGIIIEVVHVCAKALSRKTVGCPSFVEQPSVCRTAGDRKGGSVPLTECC